MFNHKGGVSKTTSVYNIGWMMAEMGKTVLMVDADPQCNLTSLILGEDFDKYYEEAETRNQNIMDGVKAAFSAKPFPIKAINCVKTQGNEQLYLMPGHMNLSEYDAQLSFAFSVSVAMPTLQSLPGAFNDLIEKTARAIHAEYVLIDLNPGLSTINEDLFLISDAFIVPANPDNFSLMAIKSLGEILPRWKQWKSSNFSLFADSAYPLPEGNPKFIGAIPQRFNIRNGKPTTPYRDKIADLSRETKETFVPRLAKADMTFPPEKYDAAGISRDTYILHEIKDFQGLAPKSLKAKVPVYKLSDEQLETSGAVLDGQRENVKEFYAVYEDIANKIITLLS